jgi:hypothetical protein
LKRNPEKSQHHTETSDAVARDGLSHGEPPNDDENGDVFQFRQALENRMEIRDKSAKCQLVNRGIRD